MIVRLTSDWLPLPDAILRQLGWVEGTAVEIEVAGETLILTKAGDQAGAVRPQPVKKGKSL